MSTAGLPEPCAFALGGRAQFRLSGPDAARYLGGQISNHVPAPGQSCQALVLTAKGKLCAVVFVFGLSDGSFLVDSDEALREPLSTRLGRYIVADNVELEDVSTPNAGWHVLGSTGSPADARPVNRMGSPGIDLPELPPGIHRLSADETLWLRIARGIPAWGHELDENTLPHEAGLDRSAVDFHKGCYVGQEVVSRIESVGRTNRILRGLTGEFAPLAGSLLIDEAGQNVGKITSATRHFGLATSAALGYVNTRTAESAFSVTDPEGRNTGRCQTHEFPLA